MNELELKPSYWCSVSGGKDSLFMLNLILNNLDKYPLDGVIHFELEIDYPFIKNVIDYMENRCISYNIPFVRIKPRKSWYELYEKRGFPSAVRRWCNGEYKLDCRKQYDKYLKEKGYNLIMYIGYCVDEIKRYEKRGNPKERYPLVEENIEESYILNWAKDVPIFNDYYKYNKRCGCMFCPMQTMGESKYLLKYYPDKFYEMIELAKATEEEMYKRTGKKRSVWNINEKYDSVYRKKRVEEMLSKEEII